MKAEGGPLAVAVGGGKGGSGKSMVAVNLAIAVARHGLRVVLVDADFGSPSLHALLGMGPVRSGLHSFLEGRVESVDDILLSTRVHQLSIIPCGALNTDLVRVTQQQKNKVLEGLRTLDADVVLYDTAAVGFQMSELFDTADVRVVVTTPQLPSLQSAYAFLKAALVRALRERAHLYGRADFFNAALQGPDGDRVSQVIMRITERSADFGRELAACAASYSPLVVANQLDHKSQLNALYAFSRMITDFLAVRAPIVATVMRSLRIHQSIDTHTPFMMSNERLPEQRALSELAFRLLRVDLPALRGQRKSRPPQAIEFEQVSLEEAFPMERPSSVQKPMESFRPLEIARPALVPEISSAPVAVAVPMAVTPAPPEGALPGTLDRYQRRHERVRTKSDVTLRLEDFEARGVALDVSESGAQVQGERLPFAEGEEISVEFHDPPGVFGAVVRNVREGRMGIEFVAPDHRALQAIVAAATAAAAELKKAVEPRAEERPPGRRSSQRPTREIVMDAPAGLAELPSKAPPVEVPPRLVNAASSIPASAAHKTKVGKTSGETKTLLVTVRLEDFEVEARVVEFKEQEARVLGERLPFADGENVEVVFKSQPGFPSLRAVVQSMGDGYIVVDFGDANRSACATFAKALR